MRLRHTLSAVLQRLLGRPAPSQTNGHYYNALAAREALSIQPVRRKNVLVVGCNTGHDCTYFVEAGAREVHGLDVVESIGQDFQHPAVQYHRISAECMSCFPDDMFDLVYSFATMEHVPNIAAAFQEMCRVTTPGGVLFSVAAPLWHSRYGHHKANLFQNFPWIHLCLSKEEIIQWYLETCPDEMPHEREHIRHHVEYMLNPAFFNMRPAREYLHVCAALPMQLVVNRLDLDDASHLTPDIRRLLGNRYDDEELLAVTHRYIARK
ncbi:class I SAM-dependent methyltransferase [Megalodesulfovibrio gigas]|uniref:Methyltransferase type 11 domain-containing protein n=1 Tax=Megalodesulfovibrio gigas (strain ATCC 19364 / DSM 1382 / NCIMB 9332 / VKM B-1759) TaxID=1121448 RepID=T2G881_MEGG1|nr:class I SAM-dependent methyltransferase [Megalodesulfovibrio gigas]AGW12077.1 hypothetical protein DGI_0140 [Megalodesulfovibrio gigas DSM 1382 = ATCC 19364]